MCVDIKMVPWRDKPQKSEKGSSSGRGGKGDRDGKAGRAGGKGDDEGVAADSDKGDKGGTSSHVPPTMHVVHRDFSKDCAPPLFQCISMQIGQTPALRHGSALIKVSGSAVNHDDPSEGSWYITLE